MNTDEVQVIIAGHICFDVIPSFKKSDKTEMKDIFIPGKLINMGSVKVWVITISFKYTIY